MTRDEIYQRMLCLFGKLLKEKNKPITRNSLLKEDLGLDSVDLLDFAAMLEAEFGIDIGDYESTWVNSVEDILKLVEGKIAEQKTL